MKIHGLLLLTLSLVSVQCIAQSDSFDVFTYKAPEYFIRSALASRVQFNLTNSDTSFCTITLYKSQPSTTDIKKDIKRQWNEHIVKKLTKADKEPAQIFTGQLWDGWTHTLAIGNFYQNKKKCVVMLNSFKKDKVSACTVYAFSDKSFKGPIELFSKEMHIKNKK